VSASQRHRIRWRLLTEEEVAAMYDLCGEKRSPNSKITCTMPKTNHLPDAHGGQGADGRWFFWPKQS
jgi:hypothetical protein